jgi:hypothetical protein
MAKTYTRSLARATRRWAGCLRTGERVAHAGQQLDRAQGRGRVEDLRGEEQLVGVRGVQDLEHLATGRLRRADHRDLQHLVDARGLLRRHLGIEVGDRRPQLSGSPAAHVAEHLPVGVEEAQRVGVGVGDRGVGPDHGVGPVEVLGRAEVGAVQRQRVHQHRRSEVGGERIGKAEVGGDPGAVGARAEDPDRDPPAGGGDRTDGLVVAQRPEVGAQLLDLLLEADRGAEVVAQGAGGGLVGAGGAAEPEVDPVAVDRRERPELLGDDQRRVVGEHHAAGPHADVVGVGGDVADEHRGRGARDARHPVVLGQPEPAVAGLFGAPGQLARGLQGVAEGRALPDRGQVQDGERDHAPWYRTCAAGASPRRATPPRERMAADRSGGRGVRRRGRRRGGGGLVVLAGREGPQAEVGQQAGASAQGRDDEADADQEGIDAEVGGEAAGDPGELLVGRRARQGAAVGGGGGGGGHGTQTPASGARAPLGMTPGAHRE